MLGFNDYTSWFVFIAYIALFVNNNLLVNASRNNDNQYSYSVVLVVLLVDVSKFITSSGIYLYRHTVAELIQDLQSNKLVVVYYLVPSGLYCIFNNLVFVNLMRYDPTTYTVLLQFGIVITGFIYQCVFNRRLSWTQWASLAILTCGCILTQINSASGMSFKLTDLMIIVQVLCSTFAGVYNEYLLKSYNTKLNFWMQSIIMYMDACVCDLVAFAVMGAFNIDLVTHGLVETLHRPIVIALICNNAIAGVVAGFFLTKLNSIVKKFAVAIQMVIMAIIGSLLTQQSVDNTTWIAISLVSFAIVLYSLNPFQSKKGVYVTSDTKIKR